MEEASSADKVTTALRRWNGHLRELPLTSLANQGRFTMKKPISFLLLLCGIWFTAIASGETIEHGKTGEELLDALRAAYAPSTVLGYRPSREKMFGEVDNENGKVRLVYTGVEFATTGIPNANVVNTEHTWPQSKFKNATGSHKGKMKADLHHLYPTFNPTNGARGNNPFAEIPDAQTTKWWNASNHQTSIPTTNIHAYSESTNTRFEPREDHKGNVARSMAYFYTIYGEHPISVDWFKGQVETLFEWHKQDPADADEVERTQAIAAIQGNVNPYVLDSTLFGRALMGEDGGEVPGETPTEPDDTDFREIVIDRIEKIEAELQALKTLVEEHE